MADATRMTIIGGAHGSRRFSPYILELRRKPGENRPHGGGPFAATRGYKLTIADPLTYTSKVPGKKEGELVIKKDWVIGRPAPIPVEP